MLSGWLAKTTLAVLFDLYVLGQIAAFRDTYLALNFGARKFLAPAWSLVTFDLSSLVVSYVFIPSFSRVLICLL